MDYDKLFFEYHERNPHVFKLIKKYASEARRVGRKRYGIWAIINRVRWHLDVETHDPAGFKMNNSHSSRYARLLIEKFPVFTNFFELRKLKSPSALAIKGIDY